LTCCAVAVLIVSYFRSNTYSSPLQSETELGSSESYTNTTYQHKEQKARNLVNV